MARTLEDRQARRRDVLIGAGGAAILAGRLYQDHTKLTPDWLVTPNELFYIRTRTPSRLDHSRPWVLRVGGLVERSQEMTAPAGVVAGGVAQLTRSLVSSEDPCAAV